MSTKIAIIGSGSQFTDFFLQELYKAEEFRGCTLALVDRKPQRLEHEVVLAEKLNASVDWGVRVEGHTDRKEAMEGADFVYVFIAVNQNEAWKKEFEIANKHGVHPLEAYTAGTAGLGMAIRHVPQMRRPRDANKRPCKPCCWIHLSTASPRPKSCLTTFSNIIASTRPAFDSPTIENGKCAKPSERRPLQVSERSNRP